VEPINYMVLFMASLPSAAAAYKATNALKQPPLSDHLRGNAWTVVAALLAMAIYLILDVAPDGQLPATAEAWRDLIVAALFASTIASSYYDGKHGKGIVAGIVSALLSVFLPQLHTMFEKTLLGLFPAPDIAHTYNHLSDQDLFARHGDPRVSMERESE